MNQIAEVVKCSGCGKTIFVERVLNGTNHTIKTVATCNSCIDFDKLDIDNLPYPENIKNILKNWKKSKMRRNLRSIIIDKSKTSKKGTNVPALNPRTKNKKKKPTTKITIKKENEE